MENELYGYCQVVGCQHFALDSNTIYCNDHQGEGLQLLPTLTVWDYECAINGQSACNATGLINSMSELTEKLWNNARQLGHGTEWVNHHPILQLYAYQLAHLCHRREPIEWDGWQSAYAFCKSVVRGDFPCDADYTLEKYWT